MAARRIVPLACVALALGLGGCGGGDDGGSTLALGTEAVVDHTQIGTGGAAPSTTLGITVLKVRQGTQEELKQGGFRLDPDEQKTTPYYVDVRYENQGQEAIKRQLDVGLEDQDGNLISATTIISLGGPPFAKCPKISEGELVPGQSYESCTLFLVPEGREPGKVSFLPYNPTSETEFVYWDVE
jgi:hypothetical protein